MKLLFVLEHYYPYIGGAENLFTALTRKLVKNGHTITVITSLYDRSLPLREVSEGVKIIRVRCLNRYLFTFFSLPILMREVRRFDLIHTTTYNAALPSWLVGKIMNKPVVVTFHEVWGKLWFQLPFIKSWQSRLFHLYEKIILSLPFKKYIAVSNYTKDCLEEAGIDSNRIVMIHNGLDYDSLSSYRYTAPKDFTYTYFGRLGISKGLDLLLPAAKLFSTQYPDSKLQLILPKKPRAFFKKILRMIRQLNLENHIVLMHGLPRKELYQTLCSSSCVVIPSYSEGFCFAAAEAVALGVPIISSQKGALKEVVNGRYVSIEAMNSNALYEALFRARNEQWTESLQKYFPLNNTVDDHLKLYDCLLNQG